MIYLVRQTGSYRNYDYAIDEFNTEKDALRAVFSLPKGKIIGIFNGERIEPLFGEKQVARTGIVGFEKHQPDKEVGSEK